MPRHLVHVHFTCQSFKEAHKILLRGFGPQRGGWVIFLSATCFFFRTGKKKHHILSFLEIFFRCHLCGCSKKGRDPLFTYVFMIYFDISIFDIFLHADSQILVCPFHSHFVAAVPFRQRGSSSSVGKRKRNLNLICSGHIQDPCDNFNLFLKFDKIISFRLVVVTVYWQCITNVNPVSIWRIRQWQFWSGMNFAEMQTFDKDRPWGEIPDE